MANDDYESGDPRGPQNTPYWDSDEALESLKMEREVHNETDEQLTKRLLSEAAPQAAMSIIHLALHSTNDNTRLNAAKYVTDKLLDEGATSQKQSWEEMVGEMVSEAEVYASSEHGGE